MFADHHQPESYFEYVANQNFIKEDNGSSKAVKQKALKAMKELEGWCSDHKASFLIDLILAMKPQTVVEVGVFGGKSLIPMAYALCANKNGIIFGIDPWSNVHSKQGLDEVDRNWWNSLNHRSILDGLLDKIKQFGLQDQIALILATSKDTPPIYDIDLLHIDGNHSEGASYLDVTKWVPLVRSGGIIVLSDVNWAVGGKISQQKAIDWLDENCKKQAQFRQTSEWSVWIKP